MKKIHLAIQTILLTLYSCQNESFLDEFSKQYPSDKIISSSEIEYEKYKDYYFVKLKIDNQFNLVCKCVSTSIPFECIDSFGFKTKEDFFEIDSLLIYYKNKGYIIGLVSFEEDGTYILRLDKVDGSFIKYLTYKKDNGTFILLSEKGAAD